VAREFRPGALLLGILVGGLLHGAPQAKPPAPPAVEEQEPPEEDESLKPEEYVLNPVQSKREIVTGNFYFKKGNFRAASGRYLRATRWDPGSAEAFLKLAEAREKLHDVAGARKAYEKFLELNTDAKATIEINKRLDKLPAK
jgi:tetratricopeptide (TPR) repeat protein